MSGKDITVFVAGGSGTIGRPLVRACVVAGHRVVSTTRSPSKCEELKQLGATPVVVDALDAIALDHAVRSAAPTHVVHQLTALPAVGPRRTAVVVVLAAVVVVVVVLVVVIAATAAVEEQEQEQELEQEAGPGEGTGAGASWVSAYALTNDYRAPARLTSFALFARSPWC